jgi:hypothetical protein
MTHPDDEFGTPDEENPEWTHEDMLWAVWAPDFGGHDASSAFLLEREKFLDGQKLAGIPRETFLSLEPNKPGFIERATIVLENALKSAKHAAE